TRFSRDWSSDVCSSDLFRFSWTLDGESGSELYRLIDGGDCPGEEPRDLTGSWYAPSLSGYGYSINAYQGLETNAAYFYDGQGIRSEERRVGKESRSRLY